MKTQPIIVHQQKNIYKNVLNIAASLCDNSCACVVFFEQSHIETNSSLTICKDFSKEIKTLSNIVPEGFFQITNIHEAPQFQTLKITQLHPEYQSYSFFPLKNIESKTAGHLVIIKKDKGELTKKEIETLNILCLQIEDISNSNKLSKELEKHQEGLRILNEIGETNSLDLESKLNEILRICTEYLNLETGIISAIKGDTYTVDDFYPSDCGLHKSQNFNLTNTYCDITFKEEDTIHISHMKTSPYQEHPCYNNFQLETYIGAPYYISGIKQGTVNFSSPNKRDIPFSNYDIDFVTIVTRQIGHLIEQSIIKAKINKDHNILKAFIQSTPAAIAMYDENLEFITASSTWKDQYSISINSFKHLTRKWYTAHKKALTGEVIKNDEEKLDNKNGSTLWLTWEIRPWYIDDSIGGTLILVNDITKSKEQAEELKKAKEIAEETGEMKAQFLSTMSHEIRTPLNAIIGTINLLEIENPMLAEDERMSLLKFGSNNLLSLINDVLDSQKIDSGEVSLKSTPFNLKTLTNNIIESWYPVAFENNIVLDFYFDDTLNGIYKGDNTRIGQVLNNLISNGIKFTSEGTVKLDVILKKENEVEFTITDTGIGIPADQIDHVFEDYKQVQNQHTQKQSGTGLGLSISRKLITLMGGELTVTSELNKGSVFQFTLKLDTAAQQENDDLNKKIHSIKLDLTVLLVEDNIPNQVIAQGFLNKWGVKTIIANNGLEAIEKTKTKDIDLILMDISMPLMDGHEATIAIRAMEDNYFKTLPIIALSASTSKTSHEKVLEVGMNDFILKPFDPQELYLKINSFTKKKKPAENEFKFLSELFKLDQEQVLRIATLSIDSIEDSLTLIDKHLTNNEANGISDQYHKMRPNLIHLDLEHLVDQLPERGTEDLLEITPRVIELIKQHIFNIKKNTSHEL